MGGFVGLRLAARHCELLRSLTVLDSSAAAQDRLGALKYRGLAIGLGSRSNPKVGSVALRVWRTFSILEGTDVALSFSS